MIFERLKELKDKQREMPSNSYNRYNATKDAMTLLQYNMNTANEALQHATNSHDHDKYIGIFEMLQLKYLLEDRSDDDIPFSIPEQSNGATD